MFKKLAFAVVAATASVVSFASPTWTCDSYTADGWEPTEGNVLTQATVSKNDLTRYTENSKAISDKPETLIDGEVAPMGTYGKVYAIVKGQISFKLNGAVSLEKVIVYTSWGDGGRDGIAIDKVEARFDEGDWVQIGGTVSYGLGNNDTAGLLKGVLADDQGGPLASRADELRITFSDAQDNNGTGYCEIEAIGGEPIAPVFSASVDEITKKSATLSGQVFSFGDGCEAADLYFACGPNADALTPDKVGRVTESTFTQEVSGLDPGITYYYEMYLDNGVLRSSVLRGSFETLPEPYRGLPSEYVQLDSITSSGGAYVDTGVPATTELFGRLDFIPLAYTGDANLGTQTNDGKDWRVFNYDGGSMFDVGSGRIGYVNKEVGSGGTKLTNGTRYRLEFGLENGKQVYRIADADNQVLYETSANTAGEVLSGETVYLFGGKNGTGVKTSDMTVYSFTLSSKEEGLVGDYVPCRRVADEALGLYDMKTGNFLGDLSTSGSFIPGDVVPAPGSPLSEMSVDEVLSWSATLTAKMTDLVGAETADLYFGYVEGSAVPTCEKVAEGLAEGDTYRIDLTGLNDSTVYTYAFYILNSNGEKQNLTRGTIKTAYAVPATVDAGVKYATSHDVAVALKLVKLGQDASRADIYFAIGKDQSALVPVLCAEHPDLDQEVTVTTGDLTANTPYYWAAYAINDLNHRGPLVSGSVYTLNDGDASPKWTGKVSSKWSEPQNWEPETDLSLVPNTTTVFLNNYTRGNAPSDCDVAGLAIYKLCFDRGVQSDFEVNGGKLILNRTDSIDREGTSATVTFNNPIEFARVYDAEAIVNNGKVDLVLNGTVSDAGNIDRFTFSTGNVWLNNTANEFKLPIYVNQGHLYVRDTGNLGQSLGDLVQTSVYAPWTGIHLEPTEGKGLARIRFDESRGLSGNFELNETAALDVEIAGEVSGKAAFTTGENGPFKYIHLTGRINPDTADRIELRQRVMGISENAEALNAPNAELYLYRHAGWDFNGYDGTINLHTYGEGGYAPQLYNNKLDDESVLSGELRLDYTYTTLQFGGLGDIRHTGNFKVSRNDCVWGKAGPGKLTLDGPGYEAWAGSSSFSGGEVVFDYRTYNTPRTFGNSPSISDTTLTYLGNEAEKTTIPPQSIQNNGGFMTIRTVPGAAGMDFTLKSISSKQHDRVLSFEIGEGTDFRLAEDTDIVNNAGDNFHGICPRILWDGGRNWAKVADGTLTGLSADDMSTSLGENTVWDMPAGLSELTEYRSGVAGIRFAAAGATELKIDNGLILEEVNSSASILVSPDAGGPVTISGDGYFHNSGWGARIMLANFSRTYPTTVSARIARRDHNALMVVGPGLTRLENDANEFDGGPYVYGGTVQFTSLAADNESCALGHGSYGRKAEIGNRSTLEYVGSDPTGHTGDLDLQILGLSTLKASGAGPLAIAGDVTAAYDFCRLVLDGEGNGSITGQINPGARGSVSKRGSGTWKVNCTGGDYGYPTHVEAGTLVWNGTVPANLVVDDGATFETETGATVKRDFESNGTIVLPGGEDPTGITVCGSAKVGGTVRFAKRPKIGVSYRLISAEYGCEIGDLDVPGMKVICDGQNIILQKHRGFSVIVK